MLKINEFLDSFPTVRSNDTRKAYAADLRRFEQYLSGRGIDEDVVDATTIALYLKTLEKSVNTRTKSVGLSRTTLQRHRATIKSYFDWKLQNDDTKRNPVAAVKVRAGDGESANEVEPLSDYAVRQMVEAAHQRRDRAILNLFDATGIRASELVGADRDSVAFYTQATADGKIEFTGEISVLGKGKKRRTVPLSPRAVKSIVAYLAERKDKHPALFLSNRRRRISVRTVEHIVARLAGRAGEPHAHPHQLRHTFATRMLLNGMRDIVLKKLMGHKSFSTTVKYAKPPDHLVRQEYFAAMQDEEDDGNGNGYPSP